MNIKQIDKAILKSAIREILIENKVIGDNVESKRQQKIETMIDTDFDK